MRTLEGRREGSFAARWKLGLLDRIRRRGRERWAGREGEDSRPILSHIWVTIVHQSHLFLIPSTSPSNVQHERKESAPPKIPIRLSLHNLQPPQTHNQEPSALKISHTANRKVVKRKGSPAPETSRRNTGVPYTSHRLAHTYGEPTCHLLFLWCPGGLERKGGRLVNDWIVRERREGEKAEQSMKDKRREKEDSRKIGSQKSHHILAIPAPSMCRTRPCGSRRSRPTAQSGI